MPHNNVLSNYREYSIAEFFEALTLETLKAHPGGLDHSWI